DCYTTPPRHYHTLEHILACLRELRELLGSPAAVEVAHPGELAAALLFHDAVYVVGRSDNEDESARLAGLELPALFPGLDSGLVCHLVRLTAKHGHLGDGAGLTEEMRLFLDIDMAILGSSPEVYRTYGSGVRAEWEPTVGAVRYSVGRKAFLVGLLATQRLFLSEHYHAKLEERARDNLVR